MQGSSVAWFVSATQGSLGSQGIEKGCPIIVRRAATWEEAAERLPGLLRIDMVNQCRFTSQIRKLLAK
jgi:hypothetical protein